MSVIAWDGKILAADRQGTFSNMRRTGRKIYKLENGNVIAFCGSISTSLLLLDWYKSGADKEKWPEEIQQGDKWCNIIVAEKGKCRFMDQQPFFLPVFDPFAAWGIGADFAIGAMEMGADAKTAVEIAIKWSEGCGCGVDWFEPS